MNFGYIDSKNRKQKYCLSPRNLSVVGWKKSQADTFVYGSGKLWLGHDKESSGVQIPISAIQLEEELYQANPTDTNVL